jgi:hypothetical protein
MSELISTRLAEALLFERYRVYSLKTRGSYIVGEMWMFQRVLIALVFPRNIALQGIGAILLLILALRTHVQHFGSLEMDVMEFRILQSISTLHLTFAISMLLAGILGSDFNPTTCIIVAFAVNCYFFVSVLLKNEAGEANAAHVYLFEGGYGEVVTSIDRLMCLIKKKVSNQENELFNLLFATISDHNKECTRPQC